MCRSSIIVNSSDALSLDLNPINTKPATDHSPVNLEGEQSQMQSENLSSSADNNNNNNRNPQQPLSCSDTDEKLAALRMTINKAQWIINHQRMILQGYGDLAQRHAELKCEFDLISLEKTMLQLDLERERWTHHNEIKVVKSHLDRRRKASNVRSKSFLERATSTIQTGLNKQVLANRSILDRPYFNSVQR